jgi:arsenate reductase
MENRIKVLFICQHNSGRSQMAEAYLRQFYGDRFEVESAGLEPSERINPLVAQVMTEEGIDLSHKKPQSLFSLFKKGRLFDYVITVCHDGESKCPIFPGITRRVHVPFPDPAAVTGSEIEKLEQVRRIRDDIKAWLLQPSLTAIDFKALAAAQVG